jgi:UDP-glucose 4-epimerase
VENLVQMVSGSTLVSKNLVHNYFSRHNVAQVLQDALFNCVEENIQNPFEYLYDYIGSKFLHKENDKLALEHVIHSKDDEIKKLQEQLKGT